MPYYFVRCTVCKKLNLWGQPCPNEGTDKHKVHDPKTQEKSK